MRQIPLKHLTVLAPLAAVIVVAVLILDRVSTIHQAELVASRFRAEIKPTSYDPADPFSDPPAPGADPATWVTLKPYNGVYGKDKSRVWYNNRLVPDAEMESFNASDLWGWDAHHVFYQARVVPGADPKTFIPVGVNYGKDAYRVYFATTTVPGADPQTIKMISDYVYAKDRYHVYVGGKIIPGADPKTYTPPAP